MVITKDLGAVSAYAYAVEQGYQGTEEEFAELMARQATVAEEAAASADAAAESERNAQASAEQAEQSAQSISGDVERAEQAATTATGKATEAAASATTANGAAQTARGKAAQAEQSATAAAQSESAAESSATDAEMAKQAAQTAQTAAETAQGKAEDAQAAAEAAAQSVSASAAQIAKNTDNFAPAFSASTAYAIGDYCIHEGALYRFTNAHTGAWVSGDAESVDVGGEARDLRTDINKTFYTVLGDNLVNPAKNVVGAISSNGNVDSSSTSYITSDFIEIEEDTDYIITCWRSSDWVYRSTRKYVALYNASKRLVEGSYQNVNSVASITFNTGSAKYARVSWQDPYVGFLAKGSTFPTSFVAYSETYYTNLIVKNYKDDTIPLQALSTESKGAIAFISIKNLFVSADSSSGMLQKADGGIDTTTTGYTTSAFMPIKNGYTYKISPRCRRICFYSSNSVETFIACDDANVNTPYTFVSQYNGYMRFSIGNSYVSNATCVESYIGTSEKKLEEGISLSNFQKDEVKDLSAYSNRLRGKKWAVCGDSFTDGGGTGTVITDGKYAGHNYTYPWLIGNRCDMNIVQFFAGGRTLAFPAVPDTFDNSITCSTANWYYQNIPADADFITIYLGINDEHHATGGGDGEDPTGYIPLGTIDDSTTASYYGAWNVVLSWLIENRPNAHIGIIVTNGLSIEGYRTAQIAIARKYGIPFIDMNGDDRTPAMLRTVNPDISDSVKQILKEKWSVDYPSNQHPNDDAQLFESYFIENFLLSL